MVSSHDFTLSSVDEAGGEPAFTKSGSGAAAVGAATASSQANIGGRCGFKPRRQSYSYQGAP